MLVQSSLQRPPSARSEKGNNKDKTRSMSRAPRAPHWQGGGEDTGRGALDCKHVQGSRCPHGGLGEP